MKGIDRRAQALPEHVAHVRLPVRVRVDLRMMNSICLSASPARLNTRISAPPKIEIGRQRIRDLGASVPFRFLLLGGLCGDVRFPVGYTFRFGRVRRALTANRKQGETQEPCEDQRRDPRRFPVYRHTHFRIKASYADTARGRLDRAAFYYNICRRIYQWVWNLFVRTPADIRGLSGRIPEKGG